MKTTSERRTELSVQKANMKAMGILLSCLNAAFLMLGLAFLLIKLNADVVGGFAITMIVLASVIALVGICASFMFKKHLGDITEDDDRV